MKKTICLLLVLVLCVWLCACGNGNDVEQSGQANGTTNAQNENYIHPRLSEMCGAWINNNIDTNDFNPCLELTINEDHTCIVDGAAYTWDYSPHTTDERLVLYIFNGEDCIIDAVLEADGALLVCHHGKWGQANWRRAEDAVS